MCNHSNHKSEINIRLKHLDISSIKTYKIKCRTDTFIFWLLGGPENPVNARPSLYSCPPDVKEAAYKGLVRPVLEYGSTVWDPHTHGLQEELEKVQNHAARFVTANYVFETGSMTGILGQQMGIS